MNIFMPFKLFEKNNIYFILVCLVRKAYLGKRTWKLFLYCNPTIVPVIQTSPLYFYRVENHENASLAKTSSSTVGTFWSWKNFAPFALFQILSYYTVSSTTNLSISDVI